MKFNIITLGCKVNAYESNYISESLVNNGFSFCDNLEDSNIIIINTCTVTDTSDKKSLKMVRHAKKHNPTAIIVVCGCSTQNNPQKYENMGINILIGNQQKSMIAALIKNYLEKKENYYYVDNNRDIPFENMSITKFNHIRAFMKIQDGCNNFCSYCVIPYVRGNIRCKEFNEIIIEAERLINNGYKEIVLTGIHTGSYNNSNKDLTDVIEAISKIKGIERLRLSSVEITELNDKFLNMLKTNKIFCDHLHVPLQAGSNEILKRMNRKYDLKYYENKIKQIREINPLISITTDVIVGHNYETDELFEQSYNFCKQMQFSKIHVFPYSKREGTATSKMPETVDEKVKKARCLKLIELSEKLEKEYYNKFINKEMSVLIESVKDGVSVGHTSNYLKVSLPETLEVGNIYQRKIK